MALLEGTTISGILKCGLLLLIVLRASSVWGLEGQATLTQTFSTPALTPTNARDYILASKTPLPGGLSIEPEVANVRYSVIHHTLGQAAYNGPDQAKREVWEEWKNGSATVRSVIGQQWNNVEGDPTRPRVEQFYGQVGLSLTKETWPNLSLTYSQSALNRTLDPHGVGPQGTNNHTLEAALGYQGTLWDARVVSHYILGTDSLYTGSDNRINMQTITASFRPLPTLTIAPKFTYRAEQREGLGTRIDSPIAALGMDYRQSQRLLISATGSYSGMRSNDRLIDLENVAGKGILSWELHQSREWARLLLSLEAGYSRQINRLMPSAQTEDLSGLIRLIIADL